MIGIHLIVFQAAIERKKQTQRVESDDQIAEILNGKHLQIKSVSDKRFIGEDGMKLI